MGEAVVFRVILSIRQIHSNTKKRRSFLAFGRQFVLDPENKTISSEIKDLIQKSLLERNSLRGIFRAFGVSLPWLLGFIVSLYEALPDHLDFFPPLSAKGILLQRLEVEADEM